MPAIEVARRAGHGVAVLLKIYAHCTDGQATAANQRTAEALGTQDAEEDPVTRTAETSSRHSEMAGQVRNAAGTVSITAPTGPVRGLFRPRPWTGRARLWFARTPKPGTHGRIADGDGPQTRLERRMRWSAPWNSDRRIGL